MYAPEYEHAPRRCRDSELSTDVCFDFDLPDLRARLRRRKSARALARSAASAPRTMPTMTPVLRRCGPDDGGGDTLLTAPGLRGEGVEEDPDMMGMVGDEMEERDVESFSVVTAELNRPSDKLGVLLLLLRSTDALGVDTAEESKLEGAVVVGFGEEGCAGGPGVAGLRVFEEVGRDAVDVAGWVGATRCRVVGPAVSPPRVNEHA